MQNDLFQVRPWQESCKVKKHLLRSVITRSVARVLFNILRLQSSFLPCFSSFLFFLSSVRNKRRKHSKITGLMMQY